MKTQTVHSVIETYQQAEDFILSALPMFQYIGEKAIGKYDLTGIAAFLDYLGNPHQDFKSVHIAGTNGKGSVSHMLAAVYHQNGYNTGLFTSPHLITYRERIKLNGENIPEYAVLKWVQSHYDYLSQHSLSFFEMSMGLACSYFSEQKVDIAIMETGLGGRLDATNVITPILSIITNIDFDHQKILGGTLEQIAREKAGIIKRTVPAVLGNVDPTLYEVFDEKARNENAEIVHSDISLIHYSEPKDEGILYHLKEDTFPASSINLPSMAPYHTYNLNTVLYALDQLRRLENLELKEEPTRTALENFIELSQLRGRHEIIHRNPMIIADAAHNPGGIRFFNPLFENNNVHLHLVLGLVKEKDLHEILSILPRRATYYFCAAKVSRAMDAYELQQEAQNYGLKGDVWPSPQQAIDEIILNGDQDDIGLIIGSIYLIAEIL